MFAQEFDQLVHQRRSNRNFDPKIEVPNEVIQKSLERAILSPNSSNMQLWEFYWVKNEHKMKMLAEYCLGQSAAKTAKHLIVFVGRQDLWKARAKHNLEQIQIQKNNTTPKRLKRGLQYYGKLMPLLYSQDPIGIMTIVRKTLSFFMGISKPFMRLNGKADQRVMVQKSCALAAQTFMLSLTAEGFDTCPMEGFDKKRVKKMLNLPCGAEINMIIAVGKGTLEGIYGERYRLPYEEVVFEV